jgi:hypothetical protein
VTFEEATRWLGKIGGSARIERGTTTYDSVIVELQGAKGGTLSRWARFGITRAGYYREMAYRTAFVEACEALRQALD